MAVDQDKVRPIGAGKKTRVRKPQTARSVGIKIAELLDGLPTPEDKAKAIDVAKALGE